MDDNNRAIWTDARTIDVYSKRIFLYEPEKIILSKFKNDLKSWNMLDIGVGAGRTTHFFADKVQNYTGIDYSQAMVKACQERFPNRNFTACDVRDMKIFKNDCFDFVLFSFNGIDSIISSDDRLRALKEIKRVCKNKGGLVFFSSHNLGYIEELFKFKLYRIINASMTSNNPLINIARYFGLRIMNWNKNPKGNVNYTIIRDGSEYFRHQTYYINPEKQIEELYNLGFKMVRAYSLNGKEINIKSGFEEIKDPWIHYLCQR